MRLGQLARKYDVSIQQIIAHLDKAEPSHGLINQNSKVDNKLEAMVAQRFEIKSIPEEVIENKPIDLLPPEEEQVEIIESDNDEANEEAKQQELDPSLPPIKVKAKEVPVAEQKVIDSEKLLAMLENEEISDEINEITLIKAPKKSLDGLKVVGKIDLPEPKPKSSEKEDDKIKPEKSERQGRSQRPMPSEEEREKRRLIAKKKREENEALQKKRALEREERRKKAIKKARYEQSLKNSKAKQPKSKPKPEPAEPIVEVVDQRPKPKTLLGKFWRWMNT